MNRFFIGYWIKNGLDFYPGPFFCIYFEPSLLKVFNQHFSLIK